MLKLILTAHLRDLLKHSIFLILSWRFWRNEIAYFGREREELGGGEVGEGGFGGCERGRLTSSIELSGSIRPDFFEKLNIRSREVLEERRWRREEGAQLLLLFAGGRRLLCHGAACSSVRQTAPGLSRSREWTWYW